ncbi:MAG: MGMT family protein [Saprospiraceae bacterium]|nr:MGMT family protein [Saprospiraceae bacterium]
MKYKIVDIPPKMERYYGVGKMLHPHREMIIELIEAIPPGQIMTMDQFCQQLAKQAGTEAACPMRTSHQLKKMAEVAEIRLEELQIPFWRVVRKNRSLLNTTNKVFAAAKLEEEGIQLRYGSKGEIFCE